MSCSDLLEISAALDRGSYQKTCPHRIWQAWLLYSGYNSESSLQTLLERHCSDFAQALTHEDHSACNVGFCEFSSRNFTAVKQYHEPTFCARHERSTTHPATACPTLKGFFRDSELVEAVNAGKCTPWKFDGAEILDDGRPYMAISHVWSDGTGAGTWPSKQVNECLYDYFVRTAHRLRCEGLWWDTLCVPQDRVARGKALNMMHTNFEQASLTLVHDLFLRQVDFQGPEPACFAIIMSSWFTRGWTALELAKSRSVKVVFKDAIRDLDFDILSRIKSDSRAYPAAQAIRKLRKNQHLGMQDLLSTMVSRYTSWLKDRATIAGLLVGIEVPDTAGDTFQRDTYQQVLKKVKKIPHEFLFHTSPTMPGSFSWCPTSLFDLQRALSRDAEYDEPRPPGLTVTDDGELSGSWSFCSAKHVATDSCIWGRSHELIEAKLIAALEPVSVNSHLLLLPPWHSLDCDTISSGILVRVFRSPTDKANLKCQYVGSLAFQPKLRVSLQRPSELTIGKTEGWVRLGVEEDAASILREQQDGLQDCQSTHGPAAPRAPPRPQASTTGAGNLGGISATGAEMSHPVSESVDEGEIKRWLDGGCNIDNLDAFGGTPMHRAVDMGSLEVVRRAYDSAQERYASTESHEQVGNAMQSLTNIKGSHNVTTLHCAAVNGDEEMVALLLMHGADIAAPDSAVGWTPFHCAAMGGRLSVMELLIAKAKELSRADYLDQADGAIGWTPLHCAAIGGHQAIVESCLREMVDAKRKDRAGWTALDLAILNRHEAVVRVLQGSGSHQCTFIWSAQGALLGRERMARRQLMNGKLWTAFHLAALNYQGRTIRSWLGIYRWSAEELEYDINPLEVAVTCGLYNVLSLFFAADIAVERNKSQKCYSTFMLGNLAEAIRAGYARVVRRFLDGGIDAETAIDGTPLLQLALAYKRTAVAQTLLSFGANPNPTVDDGSLLHKLIEAGNLSGIRLLLNHGADVEARDEEGQTLLIAATEIARDLSTNSVSRAFSRTSLDITEKLIHLLLDRKADVEAQDGAGWTPLLHAVRSGNKDLVKQLLTRGASVEQAGPRLDGALPLFHAIENQDAEIVQLLLENRAGEFSLLWPALFCAIDRSDEATVAVLLDNGADAGEKYWGAARIPLRFIPTAKLEDVVPFPKHTTGELLNTHFGGTPLIQAVMKGSEGIVRLLLDRKIDVNATDSDGHTALFYANQEGHGTIVDLLLARGAKTDSAPAVKPK